MSSKGIAMRGFYRDVMTGPDRHIIYDSGWNKNQILDGCHRLLASMMRPLDSYIDTNPPGIRFLRVGQGIEGDGIEWDPKTQPSDSAPDLVNPFDFGTEYLDFEHSKSKLTITVTMEPGQPAPTSDGERSYPLREFALLGYDGRETDFFMVNYVQHHVVEKDEAAQLVRKIILEF